MATHTSHTLLTGDVIEMLRKLPDESVHCVITSPPYFYLRAYGTDAREIGRESTVREYVASLIRVFDEVRRVLRTDGTCWVNIADTYAGGGRGGHGGHGEKQQSNAGSLGIGRVPDQNKNKSKRMDRGSGRWGGGNAHDPAIKPKDRCGVPERFALAMQDKWWWRDEVIWFKPNSMPFSGTDRTTPAHEKVYMFTKSPRYYYDCDAIAEPAKQSSIERAQRGRSDSHKNVNGAPGQTAHTMNKPRAVSRKEWHPRMNGGAPGISERKDMDACGQPYMTSRKRSVWTVATAGLRDKHFAAYPVKLVEPMILAGTSAYGACAQCGAPWARDNNGKWHAGCACGCEEVVPCVVLDPFSGAGTTGVAALKHRRSYIGIDLYQKHNDIAERRLARVQPMLVYL